MESKKGCTILLTGLPGSGKSTIANELQNMLNEQNIDNFIIDGDVVRKSLCSDLGYTDKCREENMRRIAHLAHIMNNRGTIVIIAVIAPTDSHRNIIKFQHLNSNLEFIQVYVDASLQLCISRDPKGLYSKAQSGEISGFTGISAPFDIPQNNDLVVNTESLNAQIKECAQTVFKKLIDKGIIIETIEHMLKECVASCQSDLVQCNGDHQKDRETCQEMINILPKYALSEIDLEWVKVIAEGWAAPLRGFMTEKELLQVLHFRMIQDTSKPNGKWYSLSIPIILPIDLMNASEMESSKSIVLTFKDQFVAVLDEISIYKFKKKELFCKVFGTDSANHPTQKRFLNSQLTSGPVLTLLGGKLKKYSAIKNEDGLEQYRLTPLQIREKIRNTGADCVFAFQLRNPIHNGHALLIRDTRIMLKEKGFKKPILLLHPLGGWTKEEDVPLEVRMKQHQAIINNKVLSSDATVEDDIILAIFPSPMLYAGPIEVLWHCRSRMIAGSNYFIVGRDPAGVKDPDDKNDDLYNPTHGALVLDMCPHLKKQIEIIPFKVAAYNKISKKMEYFDPKEPENFLLISGTMMRKLAANNHLPPPGFMEEDAWNILLEYYSKL